MAHVQQFRFISFIKQLLPHYFEGKKVLEIGSLNINGSVRTFFESSEYIGVDVASGKDVDIISNGEDFSDKANSYDVIISCECMEHNPMFEKTWLNMIRLLKNDGLMIMTCATYGRAQHGTSVNEPISSPLTISLGQDYYRNLTKHDFEFVKLSKFFIDFTFETDSSSHDLYFVGLGIDANQKHLSDFDSGKKYMKDFYEKISREGLN